MGSKVNLCVPEADGKEHSVHLEDSKNETRQQIGRDILLYEK